MKTLKILFLLCFFALAHSANAQQKCTTKETVSCPPGADINNPNDVDQKCSKTRETVCEPKGSNSGNSGNTGNTHSEPSSGSNKSEGSSSKKDDPK